VKKVCLHCGGGFVGTAEKDGIENPGVIFNGLIFGDKTVAMAQAGLQKVGK
jgi:hypothetical protein